MRNVFAIATRENILRALTKNICAAFAKIQILRVVQVSLYFPGSFFTSLFCNLHRRARCRKNFSGRMCKRCSSCALTRSYVRFARTPFVKWSCCFFGCALVIEALQCMSILRLALNRHPP